MPLIRLTATAARHLLPAGGEKVEMQPGPAALTDGLDALRAIIAGVETAEV